MRYTAQQLAGLPEAEFRSYYNRYVTYYKGLSPEQRQSEQAYAGMLRTANSARQQLAADVDPAHNPAVPVMAHAAETPSLAQAQAVARPSGASMPVPVATSAAHIPTPEAPRASTAPSAPMPAHGAPHLPVPPPPTYAVGEQPAKAPAAHGGAAKRVGIVVAAIVGFALLCGLVFAAFSFIRRVVAPLVPTAISTSTATDDSAFSQPASSDLREATAAMTDLGARIWDTLGDNDRAGFLALWHDPEDAALSDFFYSMQSHYNEALTEYMPVLVCDSDPYYFAGVVYSLTTGTHPDTKTMKSNFNFSFSKKDGKWLLDSSPECNEAIVAVFKSTVAPTGYADAIGQGRNAFLFDNYLWVSSNLVYPGALEAAIVLAWQNADGSVDIAVDIKNGTDVIYSINRLAVSLTDETLGQIVENHETITSGNPVPPGQSKLVLINVPAQDVPTGDAAWSSVSSSVDFQYD